ncbi:MAG: hypothetical protein QXF28_03595 [Nitrososphaerota archaeon]
MSKLEKFYVFCIMLAFISFIIYLYGYFDREFIRVSSNMIFPVYALVPVFSAYFATRKYGLGSILGYAMFAFFIGLLSWFVGELVWAIYVLVYSIEIPFPSIADIFYLLGYPLIYFGLVSYLKVFKNAFNKKVISISSISGLIVVIVTIIFVIPEALFSSSNVIEGAISTIYPMFDAIFIVLAIMGALIFGGGRIQSSWILLSIGLMLIGIVDLLYYYQILVGGIWEGHPLELIYLWAYLHLAVAFYNHTKKI